ncbi:MAG: thiol reductant ABC exporter subunit CydD [Acidimicrobiia bacterium]|nr:thiol reductant ABC exporter subunit CydD [Acidimicrobiia bacterium]
MTEPVRPVVDGVDPLDAGARKARRGPVDTELLRLVPPLRRHLRVCAGLALLTTLVVLAEAAIIGRELPRLVSGQAGTAARLAGALAVVGLVRLGSAWAHEWSAAVAADGTRRSVTGRVVDHVLALDETGAAQVSPARATTLVTDGVDALTPWIRAYVPALCQAVTVPLAAGCAILVADPASALILAVTVPLIPVFMVLIGRYTEDRTRRQWATLQRLTGHFHDVLVGLPTLRLFGRAHAQVQRVRAVSEQYRVAVMRTLRVAFLSAAAMELLSMLSVALVAVTIGYRLSTGSVSLETALFVLLLAPECSAPIRRVGAAFHTAQAGADAAAELREVLAAPTTPDGDIRAVDAVAPSLRFSGVTVVDPRRGRRVGPVDAEIPGGSVLAVVGPSGAGKTTLLDAVRCRVPLTEGSIELGGVAVDALTRSARNAACAWVPQHVDPVGTDVRTAVAAGTPHDPPRRSADSGEVDDVLAALDLTALASRNLSELSGGELQRVAVARAVLRCRTDPRVLVLLADEPTSHLDEARSDLVLAALAGVAAAGTAVVVATHDSRITDRADRVVAVAAPEAAGTLDSHDVAGPADPAAPASLPPAPDPSAQATAAAHAGSSDDLGWYRRLIRHQRVRVVAGRVLGVAAEACTVGLVGTAAWLIMRAAERPSFSDLALAAVAVRAFALGKGLLRYCERLVSHDAVFRAIADVRGAVVERLGRIAPGGVPDMGRGDVMARVVDDVDRLSDLELRVRGPMVSGVVVGAATSVVAWLVAPAFGIVYAAAVVVVTVLLTGATRVLTAASVRRRTAARTELAGDTLELAECADVLVSNGASREWTDRIAAAVDSLGREERHRGRRMGGVEAGAALVAPLLAAAVVVVYGTVGSPSVSGPVLGALVLVPFALMEVLAPLLQAGETHVAVRTAARRVHALLQAPDPVAEPAEPVTVPDSTASVELAAATLRWPRSARPVMTGLDLALDAGTALRIEGPSGSGKSTIAAALVRFIGIDRGHYLLGGVDTNRIGGDKVRDVVVWCQQSPWLAATSVRENLLLAAPDATDEQLWDALGSVQLAGWAAELADGLSTPVGRGGTAVSGGQRQRLALARVLLAGRRVVVLDEPTAHLDATTADLVLRDLLGALGDRTVVVLAHGRHRAPGGDVPTLDLTPTADRSDDVASRR